MAAPIGHRLATSGAIVAYVALVTVISIAASVLVTTIAISVLIGWDANTSLPAPRFQLIAFAISIGVPAVVVPIMTYQRALLVRELARARDALHLLAHTDQLTGLLNRRGFDEAALDLIARTRMSGGKLVAMMADFDNFKSINDDLGHDFGDSALIHLAQLMTTHGRALGAIVARQGGDEFALLLGSLNTGAAIEMAQAMHKDVSSKPVVFDNQARCLSCSIGIAVADANLTSLSAIMSAADKALLDAKRLGRDRIMRVDL